MNDQIKIKIEDGLSWFTNLIGELREKDLLQLLDDMASVEYLETEAKNYLDTLGALRENEVTSEESESELDAED